MSHDLHKISSRNTLPARREPYWAAPIAPGRYIGCRKLPDGTCTWIARARCDDGGQRYRSLGQATDKFDFTAAKRAAGDWFRDFDVDVNSDPKFTVQGACENYLADLRAEGRVATAADAEGRFRTTVYGHPIAKVRLAKLRTRVLREWRDGLDVSKSTQNRLLTMLRAALNRAVQDRLVHADIAIEWRTLKPHTGADRRRELFLDLDQRRALLAACSGALRDLVEAAMLSGARPGELVSAKRSAFDARTGTLELTGKTGTRKIPLSPTATTLFKRLAQGKLPSAHLLLRDNGTPWIRGGVQGWVRLFSAAAAAAELPDGAVLYTLRHSWITEHLTSGKMSTLDVAKLTGTSLVMIQKHYGHLVADAARERLAAVQMV